MSRRTDYAPNHVREGRYASGWDADGADEYRRIEAHRAEQRRFAEEAAAVKGPSAEAVAHRLASAAVVPLATAVPCLEHAAAIGDRCWSHGVCGDRLARAWRAA